MIKRSIPFKMQRMTGIAVLLVCLWNTPYAGMGEGTDIWKTKENLVRRLTAEWHKTRVLQRELESQRDVLGTMRDLELYPASLTGLDDKQVVLFDRALEVLQKKNKDIQDKVNGFIPPTTDALQIVRAMIVDEPVASMFEALERGNLRRIAEMIDVKHSIDTLWISTDSLMAAAMAGSGLTIKKKGGDGPIEDEFFDLLKANLGMQSVSYFNRFALLKKSFIVKASQEQIDMMLRIDRERIMNYLKERKLDLAERKINDLSECYAGHIATGETAFFMAKVKMMQGNYHDVLRLLPGIPMTSDNRRLLVLYRLQSLYALQEYATILADTSTGEIADLSGADLNLAIWLTIESGLALKRSDAGRQYIQLIERERSFALHAMHAVARLFLFRGDDTTALSVLLEAEQIKPITDNDRVALTEVKNAIAELYFDRGDYKKAEALFYQQLNTQGMFEHALSGIAWCYLETGNYAKAETALRKLINQSPESAVGVDAILTLARQYLQKASRSWDKYSYIEKERERLELYLKRINEMSIADSSKSKAATVSVARERLYGLLDRIGKEKVADRETILAYYTNINKLCDFIVSHYYTGTYQETYFSRSREHVLSIIDSTLEMMSNADRELPESMVSNAQMERLKIRTTVDNATTFSVVSLIDKYKWEEEYVEWRKKQINKIRQGAPSAPVIPADSTPVEGKQTAATSTAEHAIDSLLAYERSMNQRYASLLKKDIERLLSGKLDSADQCYLNYQLGELYYQEENNRYLEQYDRYEKTATANKENAQGSYDRDGDLPEMEPPELDHKTSMRFYRSAIETSPSSVFAGGAIYSLAWCFNDLGQIDSAYYYMNRLVHEYPDNPHTPQAWMFCGEYFFDKGNLPKALESYLWVMKYPESEWFDKALYKVAWTQYRMSNPNKAISSFLALVDLGYGMMGKSMLEKESMDYIAISFSEIDASGQKGLERAAAFVAKLGDKQRGSQILHRLAQVYKDQGRYEMAKKTYKYLLSTYPNYELNPQVEAEMLGVQERGLPTEMAIEQKYDYFKKYNRKSAWALKQNDSIRVIADSISAKMLYDAAVSFHQYALEGSKKDVYQKAILTYTDYVNYYRNLPLANECHYNLAEIQFLLGNYHAAVEDFMAVSRLYPDSKYKETAAWNAIVAAQNILKAEIANKQQDKQ